MLTLLIVKELIAKNLLVITSICIAIACAEAELLISKASELASDGLKVVLRRVYTPVLHMYSCIDVNRILLLSSVLQAY